MTKYKLKKAKPQQYEEEEVLLAFYNDLLSVAVSNNPSKIIDKIHIPMSDVFYVREAIYNDTGIRYTLAYVEWAMMKEGFLDASDCFDGPTRMKWDEFQGNTISNSRRK